MLRRTLNCSLQVWVSFSLLFYQCGIYMNTGNSETSYSEQLMVLTVSGKEKDPPGRSLT